jgi:DNA-binding NarL/FixJ family response regulator
MMRNPFLIIGVSPPDHIHGLTPRELEVLRFLATGKTHKGIAADLFISERTVDRHVSNILSNLNVNTRSAATAFAYKNDLI